MHTQRKDTRMPDKKLAFNNLVVEITRRCNMACAHCMRGEAQDYDISKEVIDTLLDRTSHIDTITFTGGEPTLNIDAINYILEACTARNIPVENYYVVTNGKQVPDEFILAMTRWHMYAVQSNHGYEPEIAGISLSQDMFHEEISSESKAKLSALTTFTPTDHRFDYTVLGPIAIGRAKNLTTVPLKEPTSPDERISAIEIEDSYKDERYINSIITITYNGDILSECDYAYDDTDKYKIGTVYDLNAFTKFLDKLSNE